jgi:hypothetical protein
MSREWQGHVPCRVTNTEIKNPPNPKYPKSPKTV